MAVSPDTDVYLETMEVVGHAELYDYILETEDKRTIYKLLNLNKKMFQYAPCPEEAEKTRIDNNLVLGAKLKQLIGVKLQLN